MQEQGLDEVDQRDLLERELASLGLEAELPEQSRRVALLLGGTVPPMDLSKGERSWIYDAARHACSMLGNGPRLDPRKGHRAVSGRAG
jgi:hypothetical protein